MKWGGGGGVLIEALKAALHACVFTDKNFKFHTAAMAGNASTFCWPHTKARTETSLKGNHFAILHRFLYLQGKVGGGGAKAPRALPRLQRACNSLIFFPWCKKSCKIYNVNCLISLTALFY